MSPVKCAHILPLNNELASNFFSAIRLCILILIFHKKDFICEIKHPEIRILCWFLFKHACPSTWGYHQTKSSDGNPEYSMPQLFKINNVVS